ncbi:MAG: YfhO family protein [Lachnospiraceae bacterium]|nr:YfhO family protein [Lachnospiraceae bacterium]
MEKYLSKIQPKHYGLVAFVLTCLSMYMMFSYEEVLSTGRYIIMEGDLFHQYVPFIKMFVRDILQGENLFFSWSLSMGMNTSLCYAYYVLSPFNLLYLILYGVDENIVTAIVIILKSGLAALMFQRFVSKYLKVQG